MEEAGAARLSPQLTREAETTHLSLQLVGNAKWRRSSVKLSMSSWLAKAIQAVGPNRLPLPLLLSSAGVNPVTVEVDDTNAKI